MHFIFEVNTKFTKLSNFLATNTFLSISSGVVRVCHGSVHTQCCSVDGEMLPAISETISVKLLCQVDSFTKLSLLCERGACCVEVYEQAVYLNSLWPLGPASF